MKTLCLKKVIILRNGEALIIVLQACNLILTLSNHHSKSFCICHCRTVHNKKLLHIYFILPISSFLEGSGHFTAWTFCVVFFTLNRKFWNNLLI